MKKKCVFNTEHLENLIEMKERTGAAKVSFSIESNDYPDIEITVTIRDMEDGEFSDGEE